MIDEKTLQEAVYNIGPISVGMNIIAHFFSLIIFYLFFIAIDASQISFQFYKSGIYFEPLCNSEKLNHGKNFFYKFFNFY